MGGHIAGPIAALVLAGAALAADTALRLDARAVALHADPARAERIGALRPLGMLELPRVVINGQSFSQLSGLAWDDDEGLLYAVSDKGALFHLRPEFRGQRLTGVSLLRAHVLRESDNKNPLKGRRADAEGLEIVNGRNGRKGDAELLVSFERHPRIVRYRPDGRALGELALPAPLNNPKAYQDSNKMLESVCVDPALGVLTAPEAMLAGEPPGGTRIFDLKGRSWRYAIAEGVRISDLACLGDGRVMVLERDFGRMFGRSVVALAIATLPPGGSDSPVTTRRLATLDAADGYQFDNFEGLTRHRGERYLMIVDDNDLFLQRTLLLYFELLPEAP